MMQAGLAAAGDVAVLKSLWRTCFGDEEAYIDQFFERVFQVEQSFTLRQDGKLTAMAFYFPLTLSLGKEEKNVAYLYAVCTDPAYRGQGQSTALLEFIAGYLAIKGYQGLALVPGTPDLFEFYEKRGYRPAFFNQVTTLTDIPLAEGKVARAEGHEYNAVREKLLEDTSYVRVFRRAFGLPAGVMPTKRRGFNGVHRHRRAVWLRGAGICGGEPGADQGADLARGSGRGRGHFKASFPGGDLCGALPRRHTSLWNVPLFGARGRGRRRALFGLCL